MTLNVRDTEGGASFAVRAQPRASREGLGGIRAGALVVRVSAPPVEGEANAAILRLLARALDRPPSSLEVVRGGAGRDKTVRVAGLGADEVRRRLDAAVEAAR